MTTFNVSNGTQLQSALSSAVGGDRIVLADGNYGKVNVFNRSYASTVTIEAATLGNGAHIDGLFVAGSKNLSFAGLDIGRALNDGEPTYTQLSWIKSSSDIALDGMHFHGSLDGNPANDGVGLTVTSVTGFEVTNSKFDDLYRGLVLQKSSNATISDNEITMIRSDGIISAANDDLLIEGNHIGEFRPNAGDHADAIQFWNTGQTKGQSNITIKDNEIFQSYFGGKEGTGIQGIFMSDPLTYGYQNVRIENNALYSNDAYNGIYVNGATDVQLLGNTVVSKSTDGKFFWIKLQDSSHIALQDNVTDRVITQNVTDFTQSGNVDFTANAAARAHFPNLANPAGVKDLVAADVGYQLPASEPVAVQVPPPAPVINNDLPPAPVVNINPIAISGDAGDNVIDGNAADNRINGGAGADTMYGHGGNDWYFVDNVGDRVFENQGEGTDRILSSVNHTLEAGSAVEILTTDNNAGTAAINLTGNELANTIYGNAGNNVVDGKAGADTLVGLGGNDWFFVDDAADRVIETAGEGTDRVLSSVSYTLVPGASIEVLTTDANHGTAAINLSGNEIANTIYGNAGANVLHGGAGNDVLVGLGGDDQLFGDAGSDQFLFGAGFGNDTIGDFANPGRAAGDTVRFQNGTFSSFDDLMAHGAQQGADAVFTLDANTSLTLHNVQLASLSAHDFIFG